MRLRQLLFFFAVFSLLAWPQSCPAVSNFSTDGRFFSFSSQNDSYAQVLDIFHQQAGVEYDLPPDLRSQRIPLVEINRLTLKSALVKILEGSHCDYILISSTDDPEKVRKLIVTGRSVQAASSTGQGPSTTAALVPRRVNRQVAEDPFGRGGDMGSDDASSNEPMMVTPVAENPAVQGQGAPQPQPTDGPPQRIPPLPAQLMQSAPRLQQQQQPIGQPLPPMTPSR